MLQCAVEKSRDTAIVLDDKNRGDWHVSQSDEVNTPKPVVRTTARAVRLDVSGLDVRRRCRLRFANYWLLFDDT